MRRLTRRRTPNRPADDIEANAAVQPNLEGIVVVQDSPGESSNTSNEQREHVAFAENQPPPKEEDLDEFEALDRFITNYETGRRASLANISRPVVQNSKWWQFWRSNEAAYAVEGEPVVAQGQPPSAWLDTDIREGITADMVAERRKQFGWNEISGEKDSTLAKIFSYFRGPILYVMQVAALLALGLQDWIDFGVIMGILGLNALVGYYQEKQAQDVVKSLQGDIAMKAMVIRDRQPQQILARELVPGDIVIIQEGQTVPGDAQLICDYNRPQDFEQYKKLRNEDRFNSNGVDAGGTNDKKGEKSNSDGDESKGKEDSTESIRYGESLVACDQSAITGESLAVDKSMGDTIYYTTGCKRGKAYAIILTSAKHSFVGRTAELVQGAKDQGHFKAVMNSIGTALLVLVLFFVLVVWIGGFYRHLKIAQPDTQNLLHYSLVLLIIGVPVGLPVVTTTTLAVGAAYLAKQKAIVQKLTAIESLAGVNVLCSDKTGTLTANKLSLRDPYVAEGQDVDWMMTVAALASSHKVDSLDPIDNVIITGLKRYPKARENLREGWRTDRFMPFDPVSKRITSYCTRGEDRFICAKGAPKAILALADVDQETSRTYTLKAKEFAQRGFRSLGVAYKKNDEPWAVLGLLSMFDPPREDTAQTIMEAAHLGVPVKMLTGDAIAIAKETCKMLGLGTRVYNSEKLTNSGLTGALQHDLVQRADGFAEVFPEHKYQVVEMLQQRGSLTAMTGDGVNDAPSLKKADCGIAVEGSSEAAQAAADIVFLAPGLSTIILSIKTARQIFQRMKSYVQYRIALCLHLELYLTTSMIARNETIRPDLVVFIALFADLATVAVAYDNAHVEPRPVEWQLKKIWFISVVMGVLLAAATWIVHGTMLLETGGIIETFGSVQEVLFLEIALTQNWLIFVTRGKETWPSVQLILAILGVDVLATLFCLFGWLSGKPETDPMEDQFVNSPQGYTDIVTVVVVWVYSIGVTVVIAVVYYVLNRVNWINDLGRQDRNKKDSNIEDIIGQINKLAFERETDAKTGRERYTIVEKSAAEDEDL
ncbi:E1-E2 ATPase-domain-containing protein [Xylaria bambusicola]|uniref:E1-E2 ATPase-domain-containing protein n=1 Tax=Xylaria bambusicola TaxID=326684 RepID=UPI002008D94D|nr:E1-E2 ATPase-domain-containing protein [Xylaria bambusicola]KAI0520986.1 E1-E2 ATPase-domain-containing protein [Xylaria bambusicola]